MSDPNHPYDPEQPPNYNQYGSGQPQYGQPAYGQPGYGQPAYGNQPVPNHPRAVTILVLGILSLVCCQILGPVAWVMGKNTVAEIDAHPGHWTGREMAKVGMILGIVGTGLLVLSAVVGLLGGVGGGLAGL